MTVNNERSSRNSSHRKLGLSEGMSVRPIEHRNRNSIPGAYTHALAFKGGFQDDARRREARVKPQTEKTFRATRRGEEIRLFCVITIISLDPEGASLPLIRAFRDANLPPSIEFTRWNHERGRTCAIAIAS